MRSASSIVLLLALLLPTACQSTACKDCATAQAVVESVAKQHADCTRLTVHCTMADGAAKACASTSADKLGKVSDPEDLQAMQTGKTVVLEESGSLDVTVPIRAKDGKFQSACGVTLKNAGMTRDQLVAKANTIAKAVEEGLQGCCANCCK